MTTKPWDGTPIPVELWHNDHLSTLMYYETCLVDGREVDYRKMRDADDKYPTILRDGTRITDHGDEDCLSDAAAVGFGKAKGLFEVTLSDLGWAFVAELRRLRGSGTALGEINAAEVLETAKRKIAV